MAQSKQLIFGEEARNKLVTGVNKVARAVTTTLGPKGRNVAIEKPWGAPNVIHDGVTVAREISLDDKFENMGAQLVKQAAEKTNETAGDGTTTATLLAQQIVLKGMKHIVAGTNSMVMKKGISRAVEAVVKEVNRLAKPVKKSDWEKVATLSAQDEVIGSKIAEAFSLVGEDGLIEVEEGKSMDITIAHKDGMEFDRGYVSPYLVTNGESMESVVKSPFVLVTDYKLTTRDDMVSVVEPLLAQNIKEFVVIADDISGDALGVLVMNKMHQNFFGLAIKAPGFGDRRKAMLEDLAILTGATLISNDTGRQLKSITIDDFGRVDEIRSTKNSSKIIGGTNKENLKARIKIIETEIQRTTSDFDKEKLEERKARLASGVASIQVGAATEIEMNNLKERVKDAKEATRAAIKSGIIPGGGVTFIRASHVLDSMTATSSDELIGIQLVKSVLEMPLRRLVENSGYDSGFIARKVEENENHNYGFNVLTGEFGDLVKQGVIEPALVATAALTNAASVAAMILSTDCLIADVEEKVKTE